MILGALFALGVDESELVKQIKLLDIPDFSIEFSTKNKSGISAIYADVQITDEKKHRHFSTIEKIINDSQLDEKIKIRAVKIFKKLAEAEAKIHGINLEKVHFHEVGAMDAIIDVVGACIGFEMLEIENFVCSKIHVGSGFVQMAHGKFPVPPPAVTELLKGFAIYSTEIEGELITPTGAAIIATVCSEFGNLPEMIVEKTSYGAGIRDHANFPNVLRLILGKTFNAKTQRREAAKDFESEISNLKSEISSNLVLLETNIDDISAEFLGFTMERAFEIGALDCWFTPIQMKKNRPAVMISILCENDKKDDLIELLYTETSTLGVRVSEIERNCLPRETVKIETSYGEIDVKIARFGGKIINAKPEYDQMRQFALKSRKSLREIEREILGRISFESRRYAATAREARR